MFDWISKIVQRVRARPQLRSAQEPIAPVAPDVQLPAAPSVQTPESGLRQIDFVLLVADSGNLEREVRVDLPPGLVQQCHGHKLEWFSGVTLVTFERDSAEGPAGNRLLFVEKLEHAGLPGIRCLHGTSLARFDSQRGVTLRNFHALIQHAAALRPGMFVEAGRYRADKK